MGNGDIVVTAQRRSERLRDVPISITAISAQQLAQANVRSLIDVAKLTPGLRFDYVGPNVQPTIRGIGTSFATSGGLGNVGIYVDGFYAPNPLGSDFQLLNVQNIQVLKGPQGTLFGRNTTGGAILVTTAKPSTVTSLIAQASYGSYNTQRYQGYATTGLTDNLAVDVEGLYTSSDGFIHNIVTGNKNEGDYRDWTVRTGLKYDPTANLSFLLRYIHTDNHDTAASVANAYVKDGVPLTAALQPAIEALFGVPIVATKPNESSNTTPTNSVGHANIVQFTATDDLDFATLTSYTQYRKEVSVYNSDLDYSSSPLFNLRVPQYQKTFTQELLLASKPGSRLQWTTGAFFFSYVDNYPATQFGTFGAPLAVGASSSSKTGSIAAFGDATYQLTDKLFLTAGLRYSHDMVTDAFFSNPDSTGALVKTDAPSLNSDHVTPRVVLRFKPSDKSSIYASFTSGYKPGLLNVGGGTLADLVIKPEKIKAYEVGYKYGSSDFSIDLASYYYDYKDLQVSSYNGTQSLLTNAASARIYGAEAEVRYTPFNGFNLTGSGAYTNAKYRDFKTVPVYDLSSPFLFTIINGDASGQEMQHAPKWTATAGASYALEVAQGQLTLSSNFYYTSKFNFDAAGQFPQNAYATLGLRAEWTDPSKRFTFAVYGDNVTDTHYRTQVLPSNFGIGNFWAFPATVGGSVRVKI